MDSKDFISKCKQILSDYIMQHVDITDRIDIGDFEIFVVWQVKVLQNNKALLSTTIPDGMYYEITYNGNKEEFYLDAYKKFENKCITLNELTREDLPF